MSVKNRVVEQTLRDCLVSEGYSLSLQLGSGHTGVDVLASKNDEQLHIEVIGYKDSPPARSKDFFEAFFRVVSRLNDGATRCVLALPEEFQRGLNQRAAHYGVAWTRIGNAFPELEIWLVRCGSTDSYRRTTWSEWLLPESPPVS